MPKNEKDADFFKDKGINEEDDMILGDKEDEEGSGEEVNVWDEKEEEIRENVKEFFLQTVDELKEAKRVIEYIMDQTPVMVGGKYRIDVSDNDYKIVSRMGDLNKLVSESMIFLKNYIDFGKQVSPNFDYIKNLMFLWQQKLMEEQARRFAIIQKRDYNKIYITKNLVDYYLKGIHIWISRIEGALVTAGDYITTVPPRRETGGIQDMEGREGREGMVDIENMDDYDDIRYANNSPWWNSGASTSYIKTGSKVRPRLRDIGDAHTR